MYVTRHAVSSPYFQLLVSVYQKKKKVQLESIKLHEHFMTGEDQ